MLRLNVEAMNFFKCLKKEWLRQVAYDLAEDKNVVSSPLSLMILLSLFNNGAGPSTKEEITQFLGGTDYQKVSILFYICIINCLYLLSARWLDEYDLNINKGLNY